MNHLLFQNAHWKSALDYDRLEAEDSLQSRSLGSFTDSNVSGVNSSQVLGSTQLLKLRQSHFLDYCERCIRDKIVPSFWEKLCQTMDEYSPTEVNKTVLYGILRKIRRWFDILDKCAREMNIPEHRIRKISSFFHANLMKPYNKLHVKMIVLHIFDIAIPNEEPDGSSGDLGMSQSVDENAFQQSCLDQSLGFQDVGSPQQSLEDISRPNEALLTVDDIEPIQSSISARDISTATTIHPIQYTSEIIQAFADLGLRELLLECLVQKVEEKMGAYVKENCEKIYDNRYIFNERVLPWLGSAVHPLFTHVFIQGSSEAEKWKLDTQNRAQYMYFELRVQEIFNIVCEYPESEPAIQEMKQFILVPEIRCRVVDSLKKQISQKLLTPAIETRKLFNYYLKIINAVKSLDEFGTILEAITPEMQGYLKGRKDTPKVIVRLLLEDEEFECPENPPDHLQIYEDDISESGDDLVSKWQPNPMDADPEKCDASRKTSLLHMLWKIFKKTDTFSKQYQSMLCDQLFKGLNVNIDEMIKEVEILKKFLGDEALQESSVMLRDMEDSKRINSMAREKFEGTIPDHFHFISRSYLFWPPDEYVEYKLPEEIERYLQVASESFSALKASRELDWQKDLGSVEVQLSFEDGRDLSWTVSPLQATIIKLFEDKSEWSLNEIVAALETDPDFVTPKIAFWVKKKVLREEYQQENDDYQYSVIEYLDENEATHDGLDDEVDRMEELNAQIIKEFEEEIKAYVSGMLMSHKTLPAERILDFLLKYLPKCEVEMNLPYVRQLLDRFVQEGFLEYSNGLYSRKSG